LDGTGTVFARHATFTQTRKLTKKPLVIALVGPTCTGKTALSIELAKNLNGEIIACDSRTVYQYMDIGTAKPTIQERCGIPHHLLDVVTPGEVYTAANYKEQATSALEQIIAQGKIPIVCGGTGLYARALLEGFSMPAVEPNVALREELNQLAQKDGIEALHKILEVLDPVSKGRIQANDRFRIIRAIEVSKALGRPFSEVATRVEVPYDGASRMGSRSCLTALCTTRSVTVGIPRARNCPGLPGLGMSFLRQGLGT
jgi:tRNA dimethylallyltransferase